LVDGELHRLPLNADALAHTTLLDSDDKAQLASFLSAVAQVDPCSGDADPRSKVLQPIRGRQPVQHADWQVLQGRSQLGLARRRAPRLRCHHAASYQASNLQPTAR
jgi:hypothetical protein